MVSSSNVTQKSTRNNSKKVKTNNKLNKKKSISNIKNAKDPSFNQPRNSSIQSKKEIYDQESQTKFPNIIKQPSISPERGSPMSQISQKNNPYLMKQNIHMSNNAQNGASGQFDSYGQKALKNGNSSFKQSKLVDIESYQPSVISNTPAAANLNYQLQN